MGLRSWYLWKGGRPFASLFGRLLWPRPSAGALVVHDGQVLAVDTGDYLMLPLGGLAHGETFADAARREAREETGVDVELSERVASGTNAYGGVEMVFAAEPRSDPSPSRSWEGVPVWVPLDDVAGRRWRFGRPVAEYVASLPE
jgi:ADP-ribose pyrophosphatase YjhB (NUDIX family)